MSKRLLAIIWLVCLVLPFWVCMSLLQVQIHTVKKRVKERIVAGIDSSELKVLQFTRDEAQQQLEWEHSKEFEHNGAMYDVVYQKISGDSVVYWCWLDRRETKLNQRMYALMGGQLQKDPKHKQQQKRLYRFVDNLFCQNYRFACSRLYEKKESQLSLYIFSVIEWRKRPKLPPPRNNSYI